MFQLFPVGSLSEGKMLNEAYFEPREGCKMTLFQDADTPELEVFQGYWGYTSLDHKNTDTVTITGRRESWDIPVVSKYRNIPSYHVQY